MASLQVIFEDNHLLVVNKPSGIASQGDKTGDIHLLDLAKQYIQQKYSKQGNIFCGLIHRIDRPVSGVVALAKSSKGLERMNQIFQNRKVHKTYWAVVKNKPLPEEATLVHWLVRNQKNNVTRAYDTEMPQSQRGELHYKTLLEWNGWFLLEVTPVTGRTHQIRSQLSRIGCAIKGDMKYGFPTPNEDRSIHLHARRLSFPHPITSEQLTCIAGVPDEYLWKKMESFQ